MCLVYQAPIARGCSRVVTHPGTNPARWGLTWVIWREPVCHRRLAKANMCGHCENFLINIKYNVQPGPWKHAFFGTRSHGRRESLYNRPFAQLLPGLETGHSVTVGQSSAYESHSEQSKTETRNTAFCLSETLKSYADDWPTVTGCPVSNPGNNCANGLFQADDRNELRKISVLNINSFFHMWVLQ